MSTSQQVLVLEAVVQLDRDIAKILGNVDVLATMHVSPAVVGLRDALEGALATMRDLRGRVIASTAVSEIDAAERVLRARTAIVVAELDSLRDVERATPPHERIATERFGCVDALRGHIIERIGRVNASWMRERRQSVQQDPSSDRRALDALYHVALDNAEYGFAAIGQDRDVVAYLAVGRSAQCERFRVACQILATVLDVVFVGEDMRRSRPLQLERRCS